MTDTFPVGTKVWTQLWEDNWWPARILAATECPTMMKPDWKYYHDEEKMLPVWFYGREGCAWRYPTSLKPFHLEDVAGMLDKDPTNFFWKKGLQDVINPNYLFPSPSGRYEAIQRSEHQPTKIHTIQAIERCLPLAQAGPTKKKKKQKRSTTYKLRKRKGKVGSIVIDQDFNGSSHNEEVTTVRIKQKDQTAENECTSKTIDEEIPKREATPLLDGNETENPNESNEKKETPSDVECEEVETIDVAKPIPSMSTTAAGKETIDTKDNHTTEVDVVMAEADPPPEKQKVPPADSAFAAVLKCRHTLQKIFLGPNIDVGSISSALLKLEELENNDSITAEQIVETRAGKALRQIVKVQGLDPTIVKRCQNLIRRWCTTLDIPAADANRRRKKKLLGKE